MFVKHLNENPFFRTIYFVACMKVIVSNFNIYITTILHIKKIKHEVFYIYLAARESNFLKCVCLSVYVSKC